MNMSCRMKEVPEALLRMIRGGGVALLVGLWLAPLAAVAAPQRPSLLVDIDHRPSTSLNGAWHYIVDPYRVGWGFNPDKPNPYGYGRNDHYTPGGPLVQYDFSTSPTLRVPGDWNTQKKSLFFYEGMVWYQRDFTWHVAPHKRVFLHFGSANYKAHVFVNGRHVCDHEGGFSPFDCDVTNVVHNGTNFVVVDVDNRRARQYIPAVVYDWWNYGGLTGDVSLVQVPDTYIDDYSLQLRRNTPAGAPAQLYGYVHLVDATPGTRVTLRIPELHITQHAVTDADGRAPFSFSAPGLERWSPSHPKLYSIEMTADSDHLSDDIGFRTIQVKGDQILLNGKPIFLRGVNMQEAAPFGGGRAYSKEQDETLLKWVQQLHCNFVRMAHYPYNPEMTRLTDKLGILVWSEIPLWHRIDWTNPQTLALAKQQLHEMIRRDHNKASIIFWSMSDETRPGEARNVFLNKLAAAARKQDPTRLITDAFITPFHGKDAVLDDPIGKNLDVIGYTEYIGWYGGSAADIPDYTWHDPLHKPVIICEFGAGAKAGFHGPASLRFTEEYQADVYRQQIRMFKKMPFLDGVAAWVLMDFRSPMRELPWYQDFFNRKGLVSNQGQKKKAFYVLQNYYEHLEGLPDGAH